MPRRVPRVVMSAAERCGKVLGTRHIPVLDASCAHVIEAMDDLEPAFASAGCPAPAKKEALDADEAEVMGRFWYCIAADEPLPAELAAELGF